MTRCAHAALLLLLASAPCNADEVVIVSPRTEASVRDLRGKSLRDAQAKSGVESLAASPGDRNLRQHSTVAIGQGDFHVRVTVVCDEFAGRGAAITFDGGAVVLDDREWGCVLTGRLFGGGRFPFETDRPVNAVAGAPVSVEIQRIDGQMSVRLNEFPMGSIGIKDFAFGRVGFDLAAGAMRVLECSVEGDVTRSELPTALLSAADGAIDEYRDPSIASSGSRGVATAVAVTTSDDGGTSTSLWARALDNHGAAGPPYRIDLGAVEPDFAIMGFANGAERPWKLAVQENSRNHLVERIHIFDSVDGREFASRGAVDSTGAPLQLTAGAFWTSADSGLAAGVTRLVDGKPRAALLELRGDATWSVRDLGMELACEPVGLGPNEILVRTPKALSRSIIRQGSRGDSVGYEGAATTPAPMRSRAPALHVAQAEPGFPYPLRELASEDGGAHWKTVGVLWGSAAGHAVSAVIAGQTVIVFEGGDRARREHVLCLPLPPIPAPDTAPPSRAPVSGPN